MTALLIALLALSLFANAGLCFVVIRFSRRLLEFDELFELLAHDIDINTKFFSKLLGTPLFDNSAEVKTANKNMGIISKRLDEYVTRMSELTRRELRPKPATKPNPPVVS